MNKSFILLLLLFSISIFSQDQIPESPKVQEDTKELTKSEQSVRPETQTSEKKTDAIEPKETSKKEVQDAKDTNAPIVEFGIRMQKSEYAPYDYKANSNIAMQRVNYDFNLTGNVRTIYPIYLKYINADRKYGLEFQFAENSLNKARYYSFAGDPSGVSFSRNEVVDLERRDYKLNYLAYHLTRFGEKLYFGLGLRKIDRAVWDGSLFSIYSNRVETLGPQLSVKSNIPLYENLSLNMSLEFYYTQGSRTFARQFFFPYYEVDVTIQRENTLGIFRGVEWDLSLSYLWKGKYKFYFGYNYNKANFANQNALDYRLSYNATLDSVNLYYNLPESGREIIRGYYLGFSTVL
ncbi:LA_2444/LA_4059 family outer membrane protein [Leptospira sarikeiensis]|uniref:Porin n=1 Tax=Leptospira sarikeiensis TaxID=2484943 RepID=A0A4R9KDN9_9LEPT|nr:LA_2444/LA_4059 family outer membrane protein [Leptospira sarikeiensis]TGL64241.1 hypothetical protein EHQ64_02605 [Leptospira sarikeiensis]